MSMLGLPSENERVALTSDGVMAGSSKSSRTGVWALSRRPDGLEHLVNLGPVEFTGGLRAAEKKVEQVVVGERHQRLEPGGGRRRDRAACEQTLDQQVVLEQATPASPAQLRERRRIDAVNAVHQMARLTISSLILPMARVGLSCFGQTSTQFMIVWQRNSRYGSSRLSSRSLVASSRLSAMKR